MDIRITNMEVYDILMGNQLTNLLRKVQQLWPQAENRNLIAVEVKPSASAVENIPLILGINPLQGFAFI
jgi:hypothetical protein